MPAASPPEKRFAAKYQIDPITGCWVWKAAIGNRGYGVFNVHYRLVLAHRYSFELFRGPIPEGMVLDHLCRNRPCVNPAHLEPVTTLVNTMRGDLPRLVAAKNLARTHCKNGHPFSPENTAVYADGFRVCRTCQRETARRSRSRKLRTLELISGGKELRANDELFGD